MPGLTLLSNFKHTAVPTKFGGKNIFGVATIYPDGSQAWRFKGKRRKKSGQAPETFLEGNGIHLNISEISTLVLNELLEHGKNITLQ